MKVKGKLYVIALCPTTVNAVMARIESLYSMIAWYLYQIRKCIEYFHFFVITVKILAEFKLKISLQTGFQLFLFWIG